MSISPHSDNSRSAYQKGHAAFLSGKTHADNPWKDSASDKLATFWYLGFCAAVQEQVENETPIQT